MYVQAVPVPVSGGDPCGAAVYDWCPNRDWLAAAGRASPAVAHIWNLRSEKRDIQVSFSVDDDHDRCTTSFRFLPDCMLCLV